LLVSRRGSRVARGRRIGPRDAGLAGARAPAFHGHVPKCMTSSATISWDVGSSGSNPPAACIRLSHANRRGCRRDGGRDRFLARAGRPAFVGAAGKEVSARAAGVPYSLLRDGRQNRTALAPGARARARPPRPPLRQRVPVMGVLPSSLKPSRGSGAKKNNTEKHRTQKEKTDTNQSNRVREERG